MSSVREGLRETKMVKAEQERKEDRDRNAQERQWEKRGEQKQGNVEESRRE